MVIRTTDYICCPINFTCKQIEDINLPEILNQWDVKQALPSNLNYNDSPVLAYKFSKTIGQMVFNYNLILKRLDSDIDWKPVCNCKQLGPFVNPTYKHVITGDFSIIKQDDLQIIMNKGANFRLSHHLKPECS